MKLIIQIPCYNEESALKITLSCLPRYLAGIDKIEWLIIDDGSRDATIKVGRDFGVDHIIRLSRNRGLARAFMVGIDASLAAGADIIVNLDADNQYNAEDIPKLIQPILDGQAEFVVGARPIAETDHFSPLKKQLQRVGSWIVRIASKTEIADAPSGFRALSRAAALRINVFSEYTYTLETIIQAGRRGIIIVSVPIRTNQQLRPSRLIKSTPDYLKRSVLTILRIFMTYCPMRFFLILGAIPLSLGFLTGVRWLILFLGTRPASHIPSLVLAAILITIGTQLWILGLIGDLLAVNRSLLEDIQLKIRTSEFADVSKPDSVAESTSHSRIAPFK
jgi:glycosyltransferase involved in cell wall biosynthesis